MKKCYTQKPCALAEKAQQPKRGRLKLAQNSLIIIVIANELLGQDSDSLRMTQTMRGTDAATLLAGWTGIWGDITAQPERKEESGCWAAIPI